MRAYMGQSDVNSQSTMLRPMGAQPTHVQEADVKDANKVTEEEYDEEGIVNIAAE